MAGPRFSILLPTHNRPEVLGLAIASVLAQTRPDWELLVVGDGCTDGTAALMAGYDDARIRWFDLPKGPGFGYGNRNLALQQAKGDLIAFLGHDNLYFRDHLDRMDAMFVLDQTMFAYSRPLYIDDDGVIVPFYVNLALGRPRREFLKMNNVLPATPIVHRRSCLDEVGYWDETMESEGDWDMWKRILTAYPRGIRCQRIATCLHFRASWRRAKIWAPPPLAYMRALHEQAVWYPEPFDLKLQAEGGLPQEQVWKQMQDEPENFVARIRHNCDLLEDHLAWSAQMDANFL